METTKKIKFKCAGYFHTDHRYMYRYVDEEGKWYDLFEEEIYKFLFPINGDDVYVAVAPNFLDIFLLREVGDFNFHTKRWNWRHE